MAHELFLFIGGTICYASCLATVGVGAVIGGPVIVPMLLFTSGGIAAGSWAATWMASYAGAVPAASILAFLKSIDATRRSWISFGSVFKICTALCTAIDYTEPRDQDSQ